MKTNNKVRLRLLSVLMALAILPGFAGVVRAAEGVVIYDAADVSGYHITVLARPNPISVGKVSLLVRVGRPAGVNRESPVRGLRMKVEFYHLSGPGADKAESYVQRRDLDAAESDPGTYEVSDSLQNEGIYRVTIRLTEGARPTQTEFEITARPQPDDRFLSVLLLSLFPLFLIWLIWMYLKRPGSSAATPEAVPASEGDPAHHPGAVSGLPASEEKEKEEEEEVHR